MSPQERRQMPRRLLSCPYSRRLSAGEVQVDGQLPGGWDTAWDPWFTSKDCTKCQEGGRRVKNNPAKGTPSPGTCLCPITHQALTGNSEILPLWSTGLTPKEAIFTKCRTSWSLNTRLVAISLTRNSSPSLHPRPHHLALPSKGNTDHQWLRRKKGKGSLAI